MTTPPPTTSSPRRRRAIVLFLTVVIVLLIAVATTPLATADGRYFATTLRCACRHTMVLRIDSGRVDLFNLGHRSCHDAGVIAPEAGAWRWSPYATDEALVVRPYVWGVIVRDPRTDRSLCYLRRPWTTASELSATSPPKPIVRYIRRLSWFVIPAGEPKP